MRNKKNPAAVALGRLGGRARVPKGFAKFDPERLAEASRKGVDARKARKVPGQSDQKNQEERTGI